MQAGQPEEHFVTLFDNAFLPLGLCLHSSLMTCAQPFHLWIVCMDDLVERQLTQLGLPHVSLIPLREVESDALRLVKAQRTLQEYCWTLTPFAPQFVFDRSPEVHRVTYVDADLCFFDSPRILIDELAATGKPVLITDHAYAPEYDQTATAGRFCVQFLTVTRSSGGLRVLHWWQARCLEWCFNRREDGKFGDQKYLSDWPDRFGAEVHVLEQVERTLAPWNVHHFEKRDGKLTPVFYHFHTLKLASPSRVRLNGGYEVGALGTALYRRYLDVLKHSLDAMRDQQLQITYVPPTRTSSLWRTVKHRLFGGQDVFADLD